VLEHLHVLPAHDLGVDLQALDVLLAVHLDLHHPPARARLHHEGGDLGLHLLLRLLELLHQLAGITEWVHAPSFPGLDSRTSSTLPSNRSRASCTAGSRSGSWRSRCRFPSSGEGGGGGSSRAALEPIWTFKGRRAADRASSRYSSACVEAKAAQS